MSRQVHEDVVVRLVGALRATGLTRFTLSEYAREARTPDAIVFDGHKLLALEVEREKRYEASHESISERLSVLNAQSGFFDETFTLFVPNGAIVTDLVERTAKDFSLKH